MNWHLNSSIYEYKEELKQSHADEKGNFIEKYTLVKSFELSKKAGSSTKQKTEPELNTGIKEFTESIQEQINGLLVDKIGKDKVNINFIDPKEQFCLINFETLKDSEKVRIADKENNPTLTSIEKELKRVHKKEFELNSFLLLRDSSDLGKRKFADWKKENMIDKNILRLD